MLSTFRNTHGNQLSGGGNKYLNKYWWRTSVTDNVKLSTMKPCTKSCGKSPESLGDSEQNPETVGDDGNEDTWSTAQSPESLGDSEQNPKTMRYDGNEDTWSTAPMVSK